MLRQRLKRDLATPRINPTHRVVQNGKAPSWRTTVKVAELGVHHEPTLASARAGLREEPSLYGMHADLVKGMLVYRSQDGRLMMFDDYVGYLVAQEVGREWVNVHILGEAAPTRMP
jgi:hypothetical protein